MLTSKGSTLSEPKGLRGALQQDRGFTACSRGLHSQDSLSSQKSCGLGSWDLLRTSERVLDIFSPTLAWHLTTSGSDRKLEVTHTEIKSVSVQGFQACWGFCLHVSTGGSGDLVFFHRCPKILPFMSLSGLQSGRCLLCFTWIPDEGHHRGGSGCREAGLTSRCGGCLLS